MNDAVTYRSPTERVEARLDGTTLHVRFNNPTRHNALSVDMWEAVPALLDEAKDDARIRLVVFSGAGDKAFVAGADTSQFEDQRAAREAVARYETIAEAALVAIQQFPKPTLACIRGYCVGGGVNVAIACDLRIASTDSVFFVPAARLGLGYRHSAMRNLVALIGPGAAKDLFFTARRIDAHEAKALGLVNRVAEPDALAALLAEYTTSLADNAPITIAAAKAVIAEILKPAADFDAEKCQALVRGCFESEDYAEGRRAFMEKRRPVFKGK
jgi:enoyl-CoA hydratase/carnithine racemase